MDDLKTLLLRIDHTFLFRSIARELTDLLFEAKTMGEIPVDAETWAKAWDVNPKEIWCVIDRLETEGFWQTRQTINGTALFCQLMASASKSVAKKRRTDTLKRVKELSIGDRAASLALTQVGPSAVSEVTDTIPKEKRAEALKGGYTTWLPVANFGISGMVFKPDAGLVKRLQEEFPEVSIETALAMMFEDLKRTKDRPTMQSFTYWMKRWLRENQTKIVAPKSETEVSTLVAQQLDDY